MSIDANSSPDTSYISTGDVPFQDIYPDTASQPNPLAEDVTRSLAHHLGDLHLLESVAMVLERRDEYLLAAFQAFINRTTRVQVAEAQQLVDQITSAPPPIDQPLF